MAEQKEQDKVPDQQQTGESLVFPPRSLESVLGSGSGTPPKTTWPEAVGLTAEEAERKIKAETSAGIQIQVVPPGCFVTMDFNQQRVRLYLDSSGKVDRPPRLG